MKSTLTRQEKYDLGNFALEWQKKNNRKLSINFLKVFTEVSEAYFLRKFRFNAKTIIDFDTDNLTIEEIAQKLNRRVSTVRRLIAKGVIKSYLKVYKTRCKKPEKKSLIKMKYKI